MKVRKQLLGLFLLKDELEYFHELLKNEKNPFYMFRIIKQNLIALNTFFESLSSYNLYIKQNPELKEITKKLRKRSGLITHMRNKVGGHLDDDVLYRSAQWIPHIFHKASKENRELQIGLSYQSLLEGSINTYIDSSDLDIQKEFGQEIDLSYPPDQSIFFSYLESMNKDSIEWLKNVIEIIEKDFVYFDDEEILHQSRIAGHIDFNLKNDFNLPEGDELHEGNDVASLVIEAFRESDSEKKIELLNKSVKELEDKIKLLTINHH